MTSSTPSPYFKDSKIRIRSVATYFWKNTTMWSKGNNTQQNGEALYNFVMSQNIPDKNNSIHIFIPGNYENLNASPKDRLGVQGIASGIGDKRWSLLEDVFYLYQSGNFWEQDANLRHELAHNMGLYHTFMNDRCDDTPLTPYQQWGYDNNIMSYNSSSIAMTIDQASRCHKSLQDDSYILYSGSENRVLSGTVSSTQYNGPLYTSTQTGGAYATVNISSSSASSILWAKTSGTGSFNSSNAGRYLSIYDLGSVSLKADWKRNCYEFSATYAFFKGFSYSSSPNPTTSYVTIQETGEGEVANNGNPYKAEGVSSVGSSSGITNVDVYDYNMTLISSQKLEGVKSTTVDVSAAPSGTLYLVVVGSEKEPVTLKMVKQ